MISRDISGELGRARESSDVRLTRQLHLEIRAISSEACFGITELGHRVQVVDAPATARPLAPCLS